MLANSGSPLLIAGILHLLVGNSIIGFCEGILFAALTKLRSSICVVVFVVANYASAWVGAIWLFSPDASLWADITIANLKSMLAIQVVVAFAYTVLLEFPFALFSRRFVTEQSRPRIRHVVRSHIVVQLASYVVIGVLYVPFSETSALTAGIVEAEQLLDERVRVFALGQDGTRVLEYDRVLGRFRSFRELEHKSRRFDRLMFDSQSSDGMNLVVARESGLNDQRTVEVVLRDLIYSAVPCASSGYKYERFQSPWHEQNHFSGYPSNWSYVGDVWGFGLGANNGQEHQRFGFSCPLLGWTCDEVTRLPNEIALFRFGKDQICLFDPRTNRAALLGRGTSVVPVLEPLTSNER